MLPLGDAIPVTCQSLESRWISNRYQSAGSGDQACTFKVVKRFSDACSLHPNHHSHKLVGNLKPVRTLTITVHEQPSCEAGVKSLPSRTDQTLGDLNHLAVHSIHKQPLKRPTALQRGAGFINRYPDSLKLIDLNERPIRPAAIPDDDRCTDERFGSYQYNFRLFSAGPRLDHGGHTVLNEI